MPHKKSVNLYAVVPAKKTSLRLKNKNIKLLNDKHMIGHVVKNLSKTKLFKKIIISSDSHLIHKIASRYGKINKFLRDQSLSDSMTGTDKVIRDVIKKLSLNNTDIVMCIYPTAIMINSQIIKSSYKLFLKNRKKFLISIKEFNHPIQRRFEIYANSSKIKKLDITNIRKRTQDLKKFYHDAGQFYWGSAECWLKNKYTISNQAYTYLLKKHQAFDIDDLDDFNLVKKLVNNTK